jgi:hypothetical protein
MTWPKCVQCGRNTRRVADTALCPACWVPPIDEREPEAVPDHTGNRRPAEMPPPDIQSRIIDAYRRPGATITSVTTECGVSRRVASMVLREAGEMRPTIHQRNSEVR